MGNLHTNFFHFKLPQMWGKILLTVWRNFCMLKDRWLSKEGQDNSSTRKEQRESSKTSLGSLIKVWITHTWWCLIYSHHQMRRDLPCARLPGEGQQSAVVWLKLPMAGTCVIIYSVVHKDPLHVYQYVQWFCSVRFLYLLPHSSKTTQKNCSMLKSEGQVKLISLDKFQFRFSRLVCTGTGINSWYFFLARPIAATEVLCTELGFSIPLAPLLLLRVAALQSLSCLRLGQAGPGSNSDAQVLCWGRVILSWHGQAGSTCT